MMFTQFLKALSLLSLLLAPFTIGQNTSEREFNKRRTLSIGIVMFDGFEPIEVWGQLEYLTSVKIAVTHTFADAPALDVILVPCGMGVINATLSNRTEIEEFLVRRVDQAEYILGLSFGVTHLARPGLLNAKRATTSKSGYQWIVNYGPGVKWVPQARWLSHVYGAEGAVNQQTNGIEYAPHLDSSWDPYAIVFNITYCLVLTADIPQVPGANASRPCQDCVGPIGT
ncbi:class I glutamine amidotransferase-like protein [Bipolaris maydis]|nr:class I glutamine amidotransferase-like protein [Bipolaris maydis]